MGISGPSVASCLVRDASMPTKTIIWGLHFAIIHYIIVKIRRLNVCNFSKSGHNIIINTHMNTISSK